MTVYDLERLIVMGVWRIAELVVFVAYVYAKTRRELRRMFQDKDGLDS